MEINEQVTSILTYGETCDHCLGRFFGKRSHGLSNDERGKGLRDCNRPDSKPAVHEIQRRVLGLRQLL